MPGRRTSASDPDAEYDSVTRVIRRHWGPVVTVLGVVVPVLLAYGDIKKDVAVLSTQVQDLKASKAGGGIIRPEDPSTFKPRASADPIASALASSTAAPSAAPVDSTSPTKGPKGFPSNVAPVSAPECVSAKTFNKMPCELAAKDGCRGLNSFTPERYREIRLKAGVGEYMLVCAEKTP